ncbi:amidohydrolase family protein [Streptomyces sp. JV180]|nr:amidohydrolase family protein [Streptomyces sp. JV180]
MSAALEVFVRTPPPGREILLRPDRVWDAVADAPTEGLSVLLRDGRVAAVAHGLAPGPDTDVLDMPGCTLLPGFIDCHVHLLDESAETGPAAYQTLTAVPVLRTMLHNGFTTVRDLGSAHLPLNVSLRDAVEDGLVEGPRILAAPNILSPPGGHGDKKPDLAQRYGHPIGTLAQGVEGLRRAIREQARAGADWIKFAGGGGFSSPVDSPTSTSYSRVEMHTIVATADDLGLPCAAHVFTDRAVLRAVAAGVRSVEHGCFATPPTYRAMEQAGTFLVPTQYVQTYFLDLLDDDAFWDDSSAVMRESYREHAEALREGLLRPARTDVKTAFGTDAGMFPHADNWREFPTLMGNGYTALRALRAATSVAADLLGRPDLGTLTPGAVADLVALEGDPFRDMTAVARVRHVIQRGRPVVREPATIAPGRPPCPGPSLLLHLAQGEPRAARAARRSDETGRRTIRQRQPPRRTGAVRSDPSRALQEAPAGRVPVPGGRTVDLRPSGGPAPPRDTGHHVLVHPAHHRHRTRPATRGVSVRRRLRPRHPAGAGRPGTLPRGARPDLDGHPGRSRRSRPLPPYGPLDLVHPLLPHRRGVEAAPRCSGPRPHLHGVVGRPATSGSRRRHSENPRIRSGTGGGARPHPPHRPAARSARRPVLGLRRSRVKRGHVRRSGRSLRTIRPAPRRKEPERSALMPSFDTTEEDVRDFAAAVARAVDAPEKASRRP